MKLFIKLPGYLFLLVSVLFTVECSDARSKTFKNELENNVQTNKILYFAFEKNDNAALEISLTANINESKKTITLIVPPSLSLKSLAAAFFHKGKKLMLNGVEQHSGSTKNDFSKPLEYTLIATDNTVSQYKVTVSIGPKSKKELTSFYFSKELNTFLQEDITAIIDSSSGNIYLPEDVLSYSPGLITEFTTTGESVFINNQKQISAVSVNDFSAPLIYSVYDSYGAQKDYIVSISNELKILSFSFSASLNSNLLTDVHAQIDHDLHIIQLLVAPGTDITNLVASYVTNAAEVSINSILQNSESSNDFSNPLVYKLQGKDFTSKEYTVFVLEQDAVWQDMGLVSSAQASYTDIAMLSNDNPVIAFIDNSNSAKAHVLKFNNGSWIDLGFPLSDSISALSLLVGSNDSIYLMLIDSTFKISVLKWDQGMTWTEYSSASSFTGRNNEIDMALDPSDNYPLIIFSDENDGTLYRSCVRKWNGTQWIDLGFVSTADANKPAISVDPSDNKAIVIFIDQAFSEKAHILKWDSGTLWTDLGFASTFSIDYPDIIIDSENLKALVAFTEAGSTYIYKWDGSNWNKTGEYAEITNHISLANDPIRNKVSIAFQETTNANKAHVMQLSTLMTWDDLGFLSSGLSNYIKMVYSSNGRAYVILSDSSYNYRARVLYLP